MLLFDFRTQIDKLMKKKENPRLKKRIIFDEVSYPKLNIAIFFSGLGRDLDHDT